MFWKTDWGKALILILIIVIVILSGILYMLWVDIQPIQTAHVTVISKRTEDRYIRGAGGISKLKDPNCYVTFIFHSGAEKEFHVKSNEAYKDLQEGDIGTLSFKQAGGGKPGQTCFISFEKDE